MSAFVTCVLCCAELVCVCVLCWDVFLCVVVCGCRAHGCLCSMSVVCGHVCACVYFEINSSQGDISADDNGG